MDRMTLRTLALNLVFLAGLIVTHPQSAFAALSTRGDWMLAGRHGARADAVRGALFRAADRLEWLYRATRSNPYHDENPVVPVGSVPPPPPPVPTASAIPSVTPSPSENPTPTPTPTPTSVPIVWPAPPTVHPAVTRMAPSDEASIESVAAYLLANETDPYRRIKALHDYVADRVAYDAPAYAAGRYPPQDARTVFETHVGVCARYANLFVAIGRAMHETVDFVRGDARKDGTSEAGASHAWNAVVIEGSAYLVDVTWDSGTVDGSTFTKHYQTSYFLTPAPVFGLDHFPEDPRWQLRGSPISRGDFFRQPMLSPEFYALGFELVSPDRSLVSVQGSLDIETRNPRRATMIAAFGSRAAAGGNDSPQHKCHVTDGPTTIVHCDFPADGAYSVKLFANAEPGAHRYPYVGSVEVNSAQ